MSTAADGVGSREDRPGSRRWLLAGLAVVGVVLIAFALTRLLGSFSAVPSVSAFETEEGEAPAVDCGNALDSEPQSSGGLDIEVTVEPPAGVPPGDISDPFADTFDDFNEEASASADEACDDERTSRRVVAGVTGVSGLAALAAAVVLVRRARSRGAVEPTEATGATDA